MRRIHLSIKRTAPNEWSVFVVTDGGRWRISAEATAAQALEQALERIPKRNLIGTEPTA